MIVDRRSLLARGSEVVATLTFLPYTFRSAVGSDFIDLNMTGRPDGSDVWFDPIGLLISPGQTVRWTNRDLGNSHTTTSYHPDCGGRSRRIPRRAKPWNSDLLLPNQSFSVTLNEPGVYDYYCIPHEHAGMVGRIVVGDGSGMDWWNSSENKAAAGLPEEALKAFVAVDQILAKRVIHRF